jgi:hypothetical protein
VSPPNLPGAFRCDPPDNIRRSIPAAAVAGDFDKKNVRLSRKRRIAALIKASLNYHLLVQKSAGRKLNRSATQCD